MPDIQIDSSKGRLLLALVLGLFVCSSAAAEKIAIGDGSRWTFINGVWSESGGVIAPPKAKADYYHAFQKDKVHSDLTAEFKFRITTNHSDAGLIVRAQDPRHFYLIHFPNGGQQYRAQHFWAALSVADGSGYLRFLKLALVPRVASNLGLWHQVRLRVVADEFRIWVDGREAITLRDRTYLQPGRIGLAGFTRFEMKDLLVTGTAASQRPWNDEARLPKNWFNPAAAPEFGWQHRPSMALTAKGTLLMLLNTTRGKAMVDPAEPGNRTVLLRSTDKGTTWSKPVRADNLAGCSLLTLKDGSLVAFKTGAPPQDSSRAPANEIWRIESKNDGHSWSSAEKATWQGSFPKDPRRLGGSYALKLRDGTIVLFLIGGHSSTQEGLNVLTWGAIHAQAWSTRSTDGGRSWSAPVNLDSNPPWPVDASPLQGNLDLTEAVGAETSDGKILALTRPIYSPWMWESWSTDSGRSWGPAMRGPFPGYAPTPMLRTSSGALLIATRFPGLTIHASYDDARSWDEGTYVDSSIWAMGDMVEIEPDLVFFAYMDSFQGPVRGQFIRVKPQGLFPERGHLPGP